jgi:molybdopterin-guanine dinucleotide biosynthesis protein A
VNIPENKMTAIVLAGQRDGEDELARHAGAACKAVVEIAGAPMLARVLETLGAASCLGNIIVSGPDNDKLADQELINNLIQADHVSWQPPQASPSRSAYDVLSKLPSHEQVLLTTADHPLLSPEIVDEFCNRSAEQGADLTVGLAPYALVHDKFPAMKKTVLRFKGSELCGCNLFTFLTPAGREAASYWQRVESQRKNPLRVIRSLGWVTIIKYFFGMLTLNDALIALSRNMGLHVQAVVLPYADAAVDVDSVSDYQIVQAAFQK